MAAIDYLREIEGALCAADAWQSLSGSNQLADTEWMGFFQIAFEQMRGELGECQLGSGALIDWLYDYARELRQQPKEGLYLGTVHSAKGLEFRHVVLLDGGWSAQVDTLADERRLYYVGMTRAEQTLTLCEFADGNPFSRSLMRDVQQHAFQGKPLPELEVRFQQLTLKEIDIGFAGRQSLHARIHKAIEALREGDPLTLKEEAGRYQLLDRQGNVVGRTAKSFQPQIGFDQCEVAAVMVRFAEDGEKQYRDLNKCERWEVIVPRGRGW